MRAHETVFVGRACGWGCERDHDHEARRNVIYGECNMHVKVSRRLVFIPTVDASVPSLRHDSIGYDTISLTGIDQSCTKHWRSGAFW
jgi:hypothetical protein